MSSLVLNWATPYHQLFPNNPLFPIDPKVFGCTCFVQGVRSQGSKLDLESLKGIGVIVPIVMKGVPKAQASPLPVKTPLFR